MPAAAAPSTPDAARHALRQIYAMAADAARQQPRNDDTAMLHNFPTQLFTTGLDVEQIWQQVRRRRGRRQHLLS